MTEQEQEQEQEQEHGPAPGFPREEPAGGRRPDAAGRAGGVPEEVRRLGAKYADRHAELLRRLGE
ncbi:hypothetical protein [Kitasatospora sp. NBC_01539]|uniref:hypothetical protein n=1 Tax=Kitasatospora sp. NBC_01539 TaxID=2903577 RepID=UPI0038601774